MSQSQNLYRLLSSDLKEKGDKRFTQADANCCLALSTGSAPSKNPKFWVNEDSVMAQRLGEDEYLLAVADSHWGGDASEVAIANTHITFSQSSGSSTERLLQVVRSVDSIIHQEKFDHPKDRSSTTYLLAHIKGKVLSYVSVGDSYLYVFREEEAQPISPLKNPFTVGFPVLFLGDTPLDELQPELLPDHGSLTLQTGDTIFLATDGIEEECSALSPVQLSAFFKETSTPLMEQVRTLVQRADDTEKGGGRDNLGIAVLQL